MTISEKIQLYRKSAGLSQEELAKSLLVSRQTISLWENGQTLPTIDNLIRLKEIFGISLDEMLCSDNTAVEKNQNEPFDESYTAISSKESAELLKHTLLFPKLGILALTLLLLVSFITYTVFKDANGVFSNLLLILTAAILSAIVITSLSIFATLKEIRSLCELPDEATSYLKINSECLLTQTVINGKTVKLTRASHSKVKVSDTHRGFITVTTEGEKNYIKADGVKEESHLHEFKTAHINIQKIFIAAIFIALLLISAVILDLSINTPILKIEKLSGVNIPEYIGITEKENIGLVGTSHVEYTAEIFLNEEGASELEKSILHNDEWESIADNTEISELAPEISIYNGADYFTHREYRDGEHMLLIYFADEKLLRAVIYNKSTQ